MANWGRPRIISECKPIVDAEYDFESNSTATEAIVFALSDAAGVDPTDLPTLYDYVDPDALNALFEFHETVKNGITLLSFEINTWKVFVRSDGRICVCDATQPTEPEPVFESTIS